MNHPTLRIGIAGTGFIGTVHARSARLAGARLVGVAASSPPRGRQAAEALGAERAFSSAMELAQSPEIDVLHVCTPNHLHAPLAEAALASGKHVVCEKPLALDLDAALGLQAAADASGRVVTVPLVYRYYPVVHEARERLRSGALGAVAVLHGTYLQDWLLTAEDHNWRVDPEQGGASRAFADIGSHWCDLAEFVTGQRISRLSARTSTTVPARRAVAAHRAFEADVSGDGALEAVGTEDVALVQFETDGGALGSVVVSQVSAGRKNRLWLEVDAADGSVAFDQEDPELLWLGRRSATTLVRRDPATLSPAAARLAVLPPGHPQGYADCFAAFVADTYAAIATGVHPDGLPTVADGVRSARITDAVVTSAREEAWTAVPAATPAEATR